MCGILGLYSENSDVSQQMYEGLTYLQHRGQDSVGIANHETCMKSFGLVKNAFHHDEIYMLKSNICIGHVRYGTTGSFDESCIQPLLTKYEDRNIFLCHNGNIINVDDIINIIGSEDSDKYKSDTKYLLLLFVHKLQEYNETSM